MPTWPETCPLSEYFLLISFRKKKITYFDFFTHVYFIPMQLFLHLHPGPQQPLCLHDMCSLAHALWFIAHIILKFLSDAQTLHHISIFSENCLTSFLLMVIFFSLLMEMPFFAYNLHGWKHHVGILGWILSCWDERWKVVYWSHVSPMKTFPSDQSSSVWAIYAVLIPRRKNYCLTATPHPLLASKVELGFS